MKKKRILIFSSLLLIIALVILIIIINNKSKREKEFSYMPVLYQICDENNCNYLLGSMHAGDNRITQFDDKVIDAYHKSEALAVEVDIIEESLDTNDLLLKNELTMDDILDEGLKNKLIEFSNKHILFPYDSLKIFCPGYLSTYLSSLVYLELGLFNYGVDSYFLKLAHSDNKEIISLESLDFQLSFFTDFSDQLYIDMIEDIIDNYEDEKKNAKELYELYLSSDEEKLIAFLESTDDEEVNEEVLLYNKMVIDDRNKNMSEQIKNFLRKDKDVFIVVGLAHVIGNGGIIDLLSQDNLEINRIK